MAKCTEKYIISPINRCHCRITQLLVSPCVCKSLMILGIWFDCNAIDVCMCSMIKFLFGASTSRVSMWHWLSHHHVTSCHVTSHHITSTPAPAPALLCSCSCCGSRSRSHRCVALIQPLGCGSVGCSLCQALGLCPDKALEPWLLCYNMRIKWTSNLFLFSNSPYHLQRSTHESGGINPSNI